VTPPPPPRALSLYHPDLDAAHGGWLGWSNNMQDFVQLVQSLDVEQLVDWVPAAHVSPGVLQALSCASAPRTLVLCHCQTRGEHFMLLLDCFYFDQVHSGLQH
jgi:hypothetical protein